MGMSAVKGIHLGGVGVRGGNDHTPLEAATSLIGVAAGTGITRSALGVDGRGGGGPRGVVVVEVLLSLDFTAKGEGAKELISPLTSKRGGIKITFSFSFSLMMG